MLFAWLRLKVFLLRPTEITQIDLLSRCWEPCPRRTQLVKSQSKTYITWWNPSVTSEVFLLSKSDRTRKTSWRTVSSKHWQTLLLGNWSAMIAQWDSSLSVFSVARVQFPATAEIFPWLIALCQPILSQRGRKWLNLPSMTPHYLWAARRNAEVQPRTDDGW